MPAEYNATVAQRVEIAPGLIILRVVPDRLPFEFKSGQYVVLGLKASAPRIDEAEPEGEADLLPAGAAEAPGEELTGQAAAERAAVAEADAPGAPSGNGEKMIRKAYSIASGSRSDEFLEFYINIVMSGELTPRLFRLGIKDRVYLGPKAVGVFTLAKVPHDRHVLLVATGTGLAPYMSMIRSELECGGSRQFVILHGARYSWDLGYRTELMSLSRHCPNLRYVPVITRPNEDPTWRGRSGYLQDVLMSGVVEEETGLRLSPDVLHVFLCGNPSMIEQSIERLTACGFTRDKGHDIGTIHTEEYW